MFPVWTLCAAAGPQPKIPCVIGVDTAGSYHGLVHGKAPWQVEAFFDALKALGATQVNLHLEPITDSGDKNAERMAEQMRGIDDAARAHGLSYTLDLEMPNFSTCAEITPGVNEYEHSEGRHFWLLRPEWLPPVLPPAQPDPRLRALVYDEAEHMQLSNNKYSNYTKGEFDQPFFANTHGLSIEEAYSKLLNECRRIRAEHYGGAAQLNTEQVWPDLFHVFARAGWTATPKLLKEHLCSIVISIALSAAVQYQDEGARFWASPDLWSVIGYPGHSVEALRSALLMGYWLGAECLYVENMDYPGALPGIPVAGPTSRHPDAEPGGALVVWENAETYHLTGYGKALQQFAKEYVPAHPRTVDWRTYRPRVAIVRLPDGGWGQFDAGDGHGEAPSRNRLLGNRDMPLDEPASEWLHVWPILTHGVARPGAISYNNPMVYPEMMDFFVPIDSVGMFDHEVHGPVLDSVRCFVVCGHALSKQTFEEIRQRVERGQAACIIARRLYARHAGTATLPGDWLVVDRFTDPVIADRLKPFLGPPDVARFTFADQVVEFRKGPQPDSVEVSISGGASVL